LLQAKQKDSILFQTFCAVIVLKPTAIENATHVGTDSNALLGLHSGCLKIVGNESVLHSLPDLETNFSEGCSSM
jgi:hypothetical protein